MTSDQLGDSPTSRITDKDGIPISVNLIDVARAAALRPDGALQPFALRPFPTGQSEETTP